jgi:hypothetical protein
VEEGGEEEGRGQRRKEGVNEGRKVEGGRWSTRVQLQQSKVTRVNEIRGADHLPGWTSDNTSTISPNIGLDTSVTPRESCL